MKKKKKKKGKNYTNKLWVTVFKINRIVPHPLYNTPKILLQNQWYMAKAVLEKNLRTLNIPKHQKSNVNASKLKTKTKAIKKTTVMGKRPEEIHKSRI